LKEGIVIFIALEVVTVFLVAVAMSLALAHALELPGKMRLNRETYIAVQSIYYPGFTFGGFGEGLGMVAALVLLLITPADKEAFWWTLAGLVALVAMQAVYWVATHPVNKFWLKEQRLKGFGAGFFSLDPMKRGAAMETERQDWTRLRNRWEYSHVARAGLSIIALIALVVSIAI
jgi:hypothetical protein